MQFTNNQGQAFDVLISTHPLFVKGKRKETILDRPTWRILIDEEVPRHERKQRLFHELAHIFDDVDPRAAVNDPEEATQREAELSLWIHEQYEKQGGDAVLEAMNPLIEETDRPAGGASGSTSFECGVPGCGTLTMIGSVNDSEPQWNAALGFFVMERWIVCDTCGMKTIWWERCAPEGMPMGLIPYPKPRVVSPRQAIAC